MMDFYLNPIIVFDSNFTLSMLVAQISHYKDIPQIDVWRKSIEMIS